MVTSSWVRWTIREPRSRSARHNSIGICHLRHFTTVTFRFTTSFSGHSTCSHPLHAHLPYRSFFVLYERICYSVTIFESELLIPDPRHHRVTDYRLKRHSIRSCRVSVHRCCSAPLLCKAEVHRRRASALSPRILWRSLSRNRLGKDPVGNIAPTSLLHRSFVPAAHRSWSGHAESFKSTFKIATFL